MQADLNRQVSIDPKVRQQLLYGSLCEAQVALSVCLLPFSGNRQEGFLGWGKKGDEASLVRLCGNFLLLSAIEVLAEGLNFASRYEVPWHCSISILGSMNEFS